MALSDFMCNRAPSSKLPCRGNLTMVRTNGEVFSFVLCEVVLPTNFFSLVCEMSVVRTNAGHCSSCNVEQRLWNEEDFGA